MKRISGFIVSFFVILPSFLTAQSLDSAQQLGEVVIQAYSSGRTLDQVSVSAGVVEAPSLTRFNNVSLLPAVNVIPGVRMEERSPGSYRFSIRGSLLRSPFGVRNVKFYINGFPFTDGGGNTYLNLIDFSSIGSAEIIKGPGGSLYGAGTGGVVLLTTPSINSDQMMVELSGGNFGLRRFGISAQLHRENVNARVQFFHQESNGYRQQSGMSRDAVHAEMQFLLSGSSTLDVTFLYSDLFYQTPGGLTKEQFAADPAQARPAGGPNRGAVEQHAAVTNQSPMLGVTWENDWSEQWSTSLSITGSRVRFTNPAIRNYETRKEDNVGARLQAQFAFGEKKLSKITFGSEAQLFNSSIDVFGNTFGIKDTIQTADELASSLAMLFGQAEYHLPQNFILTLGASVNFMEVVFERNYPNTVHERSEIDPEFSPRIALLNRMTPALTIYASMSRGFSPPSIAELYPSRQVFDKNIQAEKGANLEIGLRGTKLKHGLDFDLVAYQFKLKDALVIRRDATLPGEPEYFVNAGGATQRGIEASFSWQPFHHAEQIVSNFKVWNTYAYNHYRFDTFAQGSEDFSGNMLTGVAPVVNTSGIDIELKHRFYMNLTGSYVDHTPLNDANTVFANEYFLLGSRIGAKIPANKHLLHLYAGVDNALDRTYSLGNDLNAVGGRFFNAAPGRNYFAGLQFSLRR